MVQIEQTMREQPTGITPLETVSSEKLRSGIVIENVLNISVHEHGAHMTTNWVDLLNHIADGRNLTSDEVSAAMHSIMSGEASPRKDR